MFYKKTKVGHDDISSRQAILWMHPTALLPMMTSQRWVITEGYLPEDVKFHHTFLEPTKGIFGIVCISKEFDLVYAGQALPELPSVSFRHYSAEKDGIIE